MERFVGRVLDKRYQIEKYLGEGGRGATFKGYDLKAQRTVAIKLLDPGYASEPQIKQAFIIWHETAAHLDHPNIVKNISIRFGKGNQPLYIINEFIPGENLYQQRLNLDLTETIRIVSQVCLILDYAHKQGIFHRAIKPENILLGDSLNNDTDHKPFLIDFGLPTLTDINLSQISNELTIGPKMLMRALAYSSPEQVRNELIGAYSDVYAVGVLLYELSVGQTPFEIENISQAVRYHTKLPPPSLREHNPNLPEQLDQIILKTLAENPADRFQSVIDLAESLTDVIPETLPVAREATPPHPDHAGVISPEPDTPPTTIVVPSKLDPIEVDYINSNFLRVTPGESLSFAFVLTNHTDTVQDVYLSVEGIPNNWIRALPSQIKLEPNRSKEVRLKIEPPRSPESRVGQHSFTFHIHSLDIPGVTTTISKLITIDRYTEFDCRILPENKTRIRVGRLNRILIHNKGNSPETFLIRWHEATEKIKFKPARERLQIPAGEQRSVRFRALPNQRLGIVHTPLIQNLERHPISISVSTDEKSQIITSEVISRGLVPTRFGTHFVVLMFLLGLCVVLGLLFARKPTVENVVLNPFEPELNQPFTVNWIVEGNTWGVTVDLLVNSEKIKTGLAVDDEYTFNQGLEKPAILTVQATNILGFSNSLDEVLAPLEANLCITPLGLDNSRSETPGPLETNLCITQTEIYEGDPVLLEWRTKNAGSVNLTLYGQLAPEEFTGSLEDRPRESVTYTLIAKNILSPPVVKNVFVKVLPRQAPSATLTIEPRIIQSGQDKNITLTLTADDNFETLIIEPAIGSINCDPDLKPLCNQLQIEAPKTDTVYTLIAQNAGHTVSQTAKVFVADVGDPAIINFDIDPLIVTSGIDDKIVLTWETEEADRVQLEPDIGIFGPSGILTIGAPDSDTTYSLTAENSSGAVTSTVNIKVREISPPQITLFTAEPAVIKIDEQIDVHETLPVNLAWNVENIADGGQVTITRGYEEVTNKPSGSIIDRIPAKPGTITYILTAIDRFGQTTVEEVTVSVELQ